MHVKELLSVCRLVEDNSQSSSGKYNVILCHILQVVASVKATEPMSVEKLYVSIRLRSSCRQLLPACWLAFVDLPFEGKNGKSLITFTDFFHLEFSIILGLFDCRLFFKWLGLGFSSKIPSQIRNVNLCCSLLLVICALFIEVVTPLENAFIFTAS